MDDRTVRRAGLDYWPHVNLTRHQNLDDLKAALAANNNTSDQPPARIICLTTKATRLYTDWEYRANDCLLFGPETRGLPADILQAHPDTCLTIPMKSQHVRSLNLANAVSIVLYEAIRQLRLY
jgi:tRNA (cytidine/uridine-2'-O-)-methyltransferase